MRWGFSAVSPKPGALASGPRRNYAGSAPPLLDYRAELRDQVGRIIRAQAGIEA